MLTVKNILHCTAFAVQTIQLFQFLFVQQVLGNEWSNLMPNIKHIDRWIDR